MSTPQIGATGRLNHNFTGDPDGYLFAPGDKVKLTDIDTDGRQWTEHGERNRAIQYTIEVDYLGNGTHLCFTCIYDLNEVTWDAPEGP